MHWEEKSDHRWEYTASHKDKYIHEVDSASNSIGFTLKHQPLNEYYSIDAADHHDRAKNKVSIREQLHCHLLNLLLRQERQGKSQHKAQTCCIYSVDCKDHSHYHLRLITLMKDYWVCFLFNFKPLHDGLIKYNSVYHHNKEACETYQFQRMILCAHLLLFKYLKVLSKEMYYEVWVGICELYVCS